MARSSCAPWTALATALDRFRFWGLGFGVWGLGFGVWGVGFGFFFKVQWPFARTTVHPYSGCALHKGLGFRVWGLGFGI